MDTKLRSNREEAPKILEATPEKTKSLRGIALLLALLLGIGGVFVCSGSLIWYYKNRALLEKREMNAEERINNSWYMQENIWRYAKNLHRFYVYFGGDGYNNLSHSERLSQRDILDEKEVLRAEYASAFEELKARLNAYNLDSDAVLDELRLLDEQYNLTDEELRERVIAAKDRNYSEIRAYLAGEQNYSYIIRDDRTDSVYTNIPELNMGMAEYLASAEFGERAYGAVSLDTSIFWNTEFTGVALAEAFSRDGLEGYIILNKTEEMSNAWEMASYSYVEKDYRGNYWTLLWISLGFLIITAAAALKNLNRVMKANGLLYRLYLYLPFVLKACAACFAMILLYNQFWWPVNLVKNALEYNNYSMPFMYMPVVAGAFAILLLTVEYILITFRNPGGLKSELEVKLIKLLLEDFRCLIGSRDFMAGLMYISYLLALAAGLLAAVLLFYHNSAGIAALIVLALAAIAGHWLIAGYARLVCRIKQMTAGNIGAEVKPRGAFAHIIRHLGEIDAGLARAVSDMMKSERMKAELITNVSHDLKTPLTSIINYVALLKDLPIQGPAAEYIEVLDKKSERLGVLIEDLFEASKLQSGSAEINLGSIDLVNLLNQAMGELSEKISASGVVFKLNLPGHIYCRCDGKKIWRAFDNILGNIIKYSPAGSRAYIDVQEQADGIDLVFKNVSAYELNVEAEELFNRFKRGDSARTTEGSGLGLAIARGIVELHGGRMTIEVDGDLFKVRVRLEK